MLEILYLVLLCLCIGYIVSSSYYGVGRIVFYERFYLNIFKGLFMMSKIMLLILVFTLPVLISCSGGGSGDNNNIDDSDDQSHGGTELKSWGTPVSISSDLTGSAAFVDLDVDAQGNVMAIWAQTYLNSGSSLGQVAANYFSSSDGGWGNAVKINETDTFSAELPRIALNSYGEAVAVWHQGDTTNGETGIVWANRYIPAMGWHGADLIYEYNERSTITPKVDISDNGNAAVIWVSQNDRKVLSKLFDTVSEWSITPEPVDNGTGLSGPFDYDLAIDPMGNAMAVWLERIDAADLAADVMANYYSNGSWGMPVRLEGLLDLDSGAVKVALNAVGNGIAVWKASADNHINYPLYSNHFEPGSGWGQPQMLPGSLVYFDPELDMNVEGDAIVVWAQRDSTVINLYASVYTSASGWSAIQNIESGDYEVSNWYVDMNNSGEAFAIWSQFDGMQNSIWVNRYEPAGGWGVAEKIENNDTSDASYPKIVIDNNGNAVAAWHAGSDSGSVIWVNRFE